MSASAPPDGPVLLVDSRPDGAAGWVVAADGEVDLATSPRLRAALLEAIEEQDRVLVDLRAVTFMDSTGIATLLAAAEAARRRGHRAGGRPQPHGPQGPRARRRPVGAAAAPGGAGLARRAQSSIGRSSTNSSYSRVGWNRIWLW